MKYFMLTLGYTDYLYTIEVDGSLTLARTTTIALSIFYSQYTVKKTNFKIL